MNFLHSAIEYINLVPKNINIRDEKGYVFSGFVVDKRVYWEVDHSILQFVLAVNIGKEILSFCIYLDTQGNNIDFSSNSYKLL